MYRKWYFEVVIDHFEAATHLPPVLRIGWANSKGFLPYPGGGEGWGCNGAGDDLYSFAFDGIYLWTGRRFEPRSEKTSLRGFRPGPIQTGLYSHRRWIVA